MPTLLASGSLGFVSFVCVYDRARVRLVRVGGRSFLFFLYILIYFLPFFLDSTICSTCGRFGTSRNVMVDFVGFTVLSALNRIVKLHVDANSCRHRNFNVLPHTFI